MRAIYSVLFISSIVCCLIQLAYLALGGRPSRLGNAFLCGACISTSLYFLLSGG